MKCLSLSMLPFETDRVIGQVTKHFFRVMPRVVPDQRQRFDSDELFRKLSRDGEVKYTGFKDRPLEERQLRFQTECREGHGDLAFVSTGLNLHLEFTSNSWSENPDDRLATSDFVNFDREPGKVHLKSQFILNGVCVIWRGWVDLNRLDGIGAIEYDAERAMVENNSLQQQIDHYNRQLRDFDDRQRRYQEEQERRAEAEAEEYHRILRSRVEMFNKTHPLYLLGLNRNKRDSTSSEGSSSKSDEVSAKKMKKSESSVQVPVPVKPLVASSTLGPLLGPSIAMATLPSYHRPHLPFTSLASHSAFLGTSLHPATSLATRSPLATRSFLTTRSPLVATATLETGCPVKLYPWKPNMYLL